MASSTIKPLLFKVTRQPHELLKPAKPTPHDYKLLSDIDNQDNLRVHDPIIHFYQFNAKLFGKDPVKIIREALKETLVYYYPFAGRLREVGPGHKLLVECTGEGVVFIEADADVALVEFGEELQPPFPCFEELLYDVPGSNEILNAPLLLIQVTRLRCGGFIFAMLVNHAMSDAYGLVQFITTVGEMARGASTPSILPVWQRELFLFMNPPQLKYPRPEYDHVPDTNGTIIPPDGEYRSIFFGPKEILALRKLVPEHLHKCSLIDVLTACIWKCRTIALQPKPEEEMLISFVVNCRGKNPKLPLPMGYYGNAIFFPVAMSRAWKLCNYPLEYTLELVMKAKNDVNEENIRSLLDLTMIRGRPNFSKASSFFLSDLTRAGFGDVDFGWGKATYGGPANGAIQGFSFYLPFMNKNGEHGILVPIILPFLAMKKFEEELNNMLNKNKPFTMSSI